MNKKLIALAVGAAMAAPMAASAAPTFYGQLQAEVASIDNGGYGDGGSSGKFPPGTRHGKGAGKVPTEGDGLIIDDNKRGRLGVKGSEDLGGGLKAIYKFEWQVETTTAKIDDGTREAFVGLKGGWGEFQAGSVKSAYKYSGGVKYDPLVATVLEARSNGGMTGRDFSLSGGRYGQHGFMNNSLSYRYKAKNWSLWGTYSLDEAGGQYGRDGDITAAFKFFAKNWEVFVAYAADNTSTTGDLDAPAPQDNPDDSEDQTSIKVGGQYKLGKAHRFSVQYEQSTIGPETAFPADPDFDNDVWFLGYVFQMGKNQFIAQYGLSDFDFGGDAGDTEYLAVAWKYKFSKKTSAWLGYRSSDFSLPSGFTATLPSGATTSNLDLTAISAGLRIDF